MSSSSSLRFKELERQLDQELENNSSGYTTPTVASNAVVPRAQINNQRKLAFGGIFVGLLIAVVFLLSRDELSLTSSSSSLNDAKQQSNKKTSKSEKAGSASSLSYTLRRVGYDPLDFFDPSYTSHLTYALLGDYMAVVEPGVSMELYLFDTTLDASSPSYEFSLCPKTQSSKKKGNKKLSTASSSNCQSGALYYDSATKVTVTTGVTLDCTAHDTYTFNVYEIASGATSVSKTYESDAICLYVRREFRTYSSSDISRLMDASYTLNQYETSEGQSLYGADFLSASSLTKLHYFNAAQRNADHFHEGNGFVTQHIKLTNAFESAVQSVDASSSLFYWDFTIDNSTNSGPYDVDVASSDVFGSSNGPRSTGNTFQRPVDSVEDARITGGRWTDLSAGQNTEFPSLKTAYGYLRAPWSLNPSPYVSRYVLNRTSDIGYWPSCLDHFQILLYTDMMDYFYDMAFSPHATGHTTFGGTYGCEQLTEMLELGFFDSEDQMYYACSKIGTVLKELYRDGFIEAPASCELNTDDYSSSECYFQCTTEEKSTSAVLYLAQTLEPYMSTTLNLTAFNLYAKEFMCNGNISKIFVGDHLEAVSPSDPTFWPMHPTLERLTHAKLLSGGFVNESWASDPVNDFICSKMSCYNSETGLVTATPDCCYGHYENDQMYNAFTGSLTDYYGPTNAEILTATDPRSTSYSMSYIYDKFDWSHCASDASNDINQLLDIMYSASLTGDVVNLEAIHTSFLAQAPNAKTMGRKPSDLQLARREKKSLTFQKRNAMFEQYEASVAHAKASTAAVAN